MNVQSRVVKAGDDYSSWERVRSDPVIPFGRVYDSHGAAHASVAVTDDTIHILYTGRPTVSTTDCTLAHATAPISDPAAVEKDPNNPVFRGLDEWWDEAEVREGELYVGPEYFHIFYGGSDEETWRCGHVRTKDFVDYEANPENPILTGTSGTFDEAGVLMPFVDRIAGRFRMIYAGNNGTGTWDSEWGSDTWQTGMASSNRGGVPRDVSDVPGE